MLCKRLLPFLLLLALPLWFTPRLSWADGTNLPEMGDSSASLLSPDQERRIGRQYLRQLRHAGAIYNDAILTEYIADLGRRLATGSGQHASSFTFFVVDDPTINAFAMPGGYIGVHTGLIEASRSEDELASVLAHEMAHVTQHHLARSYKQANDMNLPMTAAVIAAILLGGTNPQLASAALATTTAASTQMQLNFTRDNEREADRVGMQVLAEAGYSPQSMPDFFQRLYEETRYYGGNVPEFLLTHPVTESRIADASNRASQYPAAKPAQTTTFEMIKARLLVEQSVDKNELIKELKTQMQDGRTANREASRFAYALALHAGEKNPQAVAELKLLHSEHPERIIYIHTLSQALSSAGEQQEALSYYLKGLRNYPDNPVLTLGAARLQLELGLYEEGRELLNSFTRQHPDNPEGFQLQAEIETRLKHRPAAHLAQAKYYYLNYDTHGAIEQLQLARKEKSDDFYYSSRIDAWLEELKEELALEKAE